MKFEKALSLLTVLALHQLAFCQEGKKKEINDGMSKFRC
jgi:hypothetical protein